MNHENDMTPVPQGACLEDFFGSDSKAQAEGKWVKYGPCEILIAFAGEDNPRYEKAIEEYTKDFRKYMTSSNMTMPKHMEADIKEAMRRAYAKAVILDWKGVLDRQGNIIPFSSQAVYDAFVRMPAFFRWARDYAGDLENYQTQADEDDAGN